MTFQISFEREISLTRAGSGEFREFSGRRSARRVQQHSSRARPTDDCRISSEKTPLLQFSARLATVSLLLPNSETVRNVIVVNSLTVFQIHFIESPIDRTHEEVIVLTDP